MAVAAVYQYCTIPTLLENGLAPNAPAGVENVEPVLHGLLNFLHEVCRRPSAGVEHDFTPPAHFADASVREFLSQTDLALRKMNGLLDAGEEEQYFGEEEEDHFLGIGAGGAGWY